MSKKELVLFRYFRLRSTLFVVILALIVSVSSLSAAQAQSIGFSFTSVPSFRAGFGASFEYVSSPDFSRTAPPVNMVYAARGDFAVSGSNLDGMMLSLMTGGGTSVHANDNLSVTFYAGPSFLFYMGLAKNGEVDADTGLGVGIAGNVSYAFDNPGFVLGLGVWANCPLVLTTTRPFAFGVGLSVGVAY